MQNQVINVIASNLIVNRLESNHSEFAKKKSWIESKPYESSIDSIRCLPKDVQP